jgi:hypothetical protein
MDQLRLHGSAAEPPNFSGAPVQLYWEPWTPFFFTNAAPETRDEIAREFRARGTPILRHPHVWLRLPAGAEGIVLNAAALMEGFALLVEVNHIYNALGMNPTEVIEADDILSSGNEYLAAVVLGSSLGAFHPASMIPTLAICRAALPRAASPGSSPAHRKPRRGSRREHSKAARHLESLPTPNQTPYGSVRMMCRVGASLAQVLRRAVTLMYDPFVLFDSPSFEAPGPGVPPDRYPGETFVLACQAAATIDPIRKWEEAELNRFYSELCHSMGLPDSAWMAEKALQVATSLMETVSSEDIEKVWLGRALDLHVRALKLRRDRPAEFVLTLLTSNGALDVLEGCLKYFSIYDLTSKEPLYFSPACIDLVTLHSLMLQALSGPNLECPLKSGSPFYCPSAWKERNTLCVFEYGDGKRSECLVDVFERKCGLVPVQGVR